MKLSPLTHDVDDKDRPRKTPQNFHADCLVALQEWAIAFFVPSEDPEAKYKWDEVVNIFERMYFIHQRADRKDVDRGNFECKECGAKALRSTVPAFTYHRNPHHVIIPIRDKDDVAVVKELKRGVKPIPPRSYGHRGRDRRHARGAGRGVNHGRIVRHRVKEKKRVLNGLREENIIAEIEAMDLISL